MNRPVCLILRSDEHEFFFSLASLWELSSKIRLGKLRTLTSSVASVRSSLLANGITIVPLTYGDILVLERLEMHRRDSFDRLLVAQALRSGFTLLTEETDIRGDAGLRLAWYFTDKSDADVSLLRSLHRPT